MLLASPNISKKFFIHPFTSEDQKNIANYSVDSDLFHYYVLDMLKKKIVLSENEFSKLNIVDYIMILIQYRMFYVGQKTNRSVKCESCNEKYNVTIDYLKIATMLDQILNISHKETFQCDGLHYTFDLPKINYIPRMLNFEMDSCLPLLLDSIEYSDLSSLPEDDLNNIFVRFPNKVANNTLKFLREKMTKKVEKVFDITCPKCKKANTIDANIYELLHIIHNSIFNFNYENCLQEYRVLSKELNMSPSYVAGISPIEKYRYIQIVMDSRENSKSESENMSVPSTEFGF